MRPYGVYVLDFLGLSSIKRKGVNTVSAPPETTASPVLPHWNIYRSAKACPFHLFKLALLSKSTEPLIIDGIPPEDELEDAWLTIYSEYCSLVGGINVKSLITRTKAIRLLSSKIERVNTLLAIARTVVDPAICAELKADGFHVDPEADDQTYLQQVSNAASRLKTDIMRRDMLLAEKPKAKNGKAQQDTEESFTNTLMEISKFEGYQVRENGITVLEYGLHVQRLKRHIDHLTNEAAKAAKTRHGR